jgi:DNA (cytosine-5)-methyltransferase 1
MKYRIADLFCGAGGTSAGAMEAVLVLGKKPELTAINHWPRAIETHTANHPEARHLCTGVDSVNPRDLFAEGELDLLWASPECTHHSRARGGKPMSDQSRATAWCVVRWAEALRPPVILIENVPEFAEWGPIGTKGQPLASRKGETFAAWKAALTSLGYKVDHRLLCAADYGDPTTRTRLFVQAVRGRRQIVWPHATHSRHPDLMTTRRWKSAADSVIDWSIPVIPINQRKRPLADRTMERIHEGLARYSGKPFLVAMEHGGRTICATAPVPTVTCAKGGAMGVAYLLKLRGSSDAHLASSIKSPEVPLDTVSAGGTHHALILEYYGNGQARPASEPLPTVTCKDRFALVDVDGDRIGFRMLQPHELAAAQGFPAHYQFTGTKTDQVRQIGNAVPRRLARAIVAAVISQNPDISAIVEAEEKQPAA